VRAYLDALPSTPRAIIDLQIDRLNDVDDTDPPLAFPHTSQVEGELRELRCHYGRALYRILYRRSRNLFVLLHIFEKHTKAVPEGDKAIARQRWIDFETRMNASPRHPPRPAGRDAP
jgi:phage-related protein